MLVHYNAVGADGETQSGELDAADRRDALTHLPNRGLIPISLLRRVVEQSTEALASRIKLCGAVIATSIHPALLLTMAGVVLWVFLFYLRQILGIMFTGVPFFGGVRRLVPTPQVAGTLTKIKLSRRTIGAVFSINDLAQ